MKHPQESSVLRMLLAPASPMGELARWMLMRHDLPCEEEMHAPVFNVLPGICAGGGTKIPVLVTPEGTLTGIHPVLDWIDKNTPASLWGETAEEQSANQALTNHILEHTMSPVIQYAYYHLLPYRDLVIPSALHQVPQWEEWLVRTFYPIWHAAMNRALKLSPKSAEAAKYEILTLCNRVEKELDNQPFLGGEKPCIADFTFAAMMGPLVLPAEYGVPLPAFDKLPPEMKAFTQSLRERAAGKLALRTYNIARGSRISLMPERLAG